VSIGYKFRVALAGLTALAMMGGVMAADPADAGKKKKKKKGHRSAQVVQVSKGGNAKAGNGGNGGNGGNSGNVNNTGNVGGPAPVVIPADLTAAEAECIIDAVLGGIFAGGVAPAGFPAFLALVDACLVDPVPALEECFEAGVLAGPGLAVAEIVDCLDAADDPVVVGGGGGPANVFSGAGGAGGAGGPGGDATGGAGGDNTNTNTVTVTRTSTDNSIDVD
jgi:hypothetical protein